MLISILENQNLSTCVLACFEENPCIFNLRNSLDLGSRFSMRRHSELKYIDIMSRVYCHDSVNLSSRMNRTAVQKKETPKTYNSQDLHVVTHHTTNWRVA